ncbi:PQQ-binding-like beta-propeller repeat protein [Streptomyces sp. NPDC057638]|uniref:outer membrane protein assembly factor BamB family protein n=1 Tax=Streptomyces sp. NPDC057638 TaxID=3346190 RepID=UPI0036A346E1
MTQPPPPPPPGLGPPQPPPPGGGFGPPVAPPPGGFGAPHPPAAPAYGFGPPTPYGPPAPPPPPPSPGKNITRIVVAAVAAVALLVGGGVWYATTSGDGGDPSADPAPTAADDGPGRERAPRDPAARLLFQLPEPARDGLADVGGSWLTDTAYIKPGIRSLVAHDLTSGAPRWTLPLPGQICASSRHPSADDRVAIVFEAAPRTGRGPGSGSFQPCTEVGAVDLTSGRLLWRTSVTSATSGDQKVRFREVTQSGETVAAGGTDGGAAFSLRTGAVLWKPTAAADRCRDLGYGGGPALVAVRSCGDYGDPQLTIQGLAPRDGTPLFSYRLPPGVAFASVVSSRPLVVAADVGDTAGRAGFSDLFSLDGEGALRARIPATGDRFQARCRTAEVERCTRMTVGNGRIYLPTTDHEGSVGTRQTNEIVSFDLATGKPTTGRAEAGDGYTLVPLRMDGGNVIAYKRPPYDKGGQVITLDGTSFAAKTLLENPSDKRVRELETSFSTDGAEYRYANGRLYVSTSLLGAPSGMRKPLAVAFGTGG